MIVYLAHPLGLPPGGKGSPRKVIKENIRLAKSWLRWAIETYPLVTPICPWVMTCEVLDDQNLDHRARGFQMNQVTLSRCDQIWLLGPRTSNGMREEGVWMAGWGKPVLDATYLGLAAAPPPGDEIMFRAWTPTEYAENALAVEEIRRPKPQKLLPAKGDTGPANP